MLKNHLTAIKGELCRHFSESILDISKDNKGEVDYEAYFEDLEVYLKDVFQIKNLDDLDKFIAEAGLVNWGFGLDYFYSRYCVGDLVTLERHE